MIEEKIAGTIGGTAVSIEAEARFLAFENAEVCDGLSRWIFFRTFLRN
jgi:hypothetical protein